MIPATLPRSAPLPPPAEKPAPPRDRSRDEPSFADHLPDEKPTAEAAPAAAPKERDRERPPSPGAPPEEQASASPAPAPASAAPTGTAPGGPGTAVDPLTLTLLHGAPGAPLAEGAGKTGDPSAATAALPASEAGPAESGTTDGSAPDAAPPLAAPAQGQTPAPPPPPGAAPLPGARTETGAENSPPIAEEPTPLSADGDRRRLPGRKAPGDTDSARRAAPPPTAADTGPLAASPLLSAAASTGPSAPADGEGATLPADGASTPAATNASARRWSAAGAPSDRATATPPGAPPATAPSAAHSTIRPEAGATGEAPLAAPGSLASLAAPAPGAAPGSSGASAPAPAPLPVVSAQPGRLGPELGVAIARHVAAGDTRGADILTLRLDPPEHGRIEVHLTFEDGAPLRATVMASHSSTLDLLRRDSGDLARALAQAGIGTDEGSFRFAQGGGGQQAQEGFPRPAPPQGTAGPGAGDAADSLPPLPDLAYRPLRASGTIDLIT